MNFQEFDSKMTPILNRFKKSYNGDILALIFNEVKNITSTDFERLTAHLLGSSRVAPMVPDFRKAINELGIRSLKVVHSSPQETVVKEIDWEYPVRKYIWANSKYFYIREEGQPHRFIIKELCDNQELLQDDKIASCKWIPFFKKITDHKYDGSLGTYAEHFQKAIKNYG